MINFQRKELMNIMMNVKNLDFSILITKSGISHTIYLISKKLLYYDNIDFTTFVNM